MNSSKVISCPGGRINLTKAIYGRENSDKETCCKRYSKCLGKRDGSKCYADALDSLSEKCNGESECTIYGNLNGILGDPCTKNHKYLKYEYECDYSTPNLEVSFCETEVQNRHGDKMKYKDQWYFIIGSSNFLQSVNRYFTFVIYI